MDYISPAAAITVVAILFFATVMVLAFRKKAERYMYVPIGLDHFWDPNEQQIIKIHRP